MVSILQFCDLQFNGLGLSDKPPVRMSFLLSLSCFHLASILPNNFLPGWETLP